MKSTLKSISAFMVSGIGPFGSRTIAIVSMTVLSLLATLVLLLQVHMAGGLSAMLAGWMVAACTQTGYCDSNWLMFSIELALILIVDISITIAWTLKASDEVVKDTEERIDDAALLATIQGAKDGGHEKASPTQTTMPV